MHVNEFGVSFYNGNERLTREQDEFRRAYLASTYHLATIGTCWRNWRLAQLFFLFVFYSLGFFDCFSI